MTRWTALIALALAVPAVSAAQEPAPAPAASLTLDEALAQARRNSPAYRQVANDIGPARAAVRSAYGAFLPSLSADAGFGYTGAGQSNFGGTFFDQSSPSLNSSWGVGLSWQLSGRVLAAPATQKALRRATEAEIDNALVGLDADVTIQYLSALQAEAQVAVARQQVERNQEFLDLARARHQVGQATLLDVRQAEVTKANSDVALLQAQQAASEAKLELLRIMGVASPVAIDQVALVDSFPISAPAWELEQLLETASRENSTLRSSLARERAADVQVKAARSEYLPSLSVTAGWSGFTQEFTDENLLISQQLRSSQGSLASCETQNQIRAGLTTPLPPIDCYAATGLVPGGGALDDDVAAAIRDQNSVFPFDYTGQPFRANLTVTLPIFTGFSRSLRIAEARAQADDASEFYRAQQLQVRTTVHQRLLATRTAFQASQVQQGSVAAARDQLRLAQDRYRLGSGTSLELADAQTAVARAETDLVNAVYDYHKAIAALEAAVGRPLR
jgi:outer membrane protein